MFKYILLILSLVPYTQGHYPTEPVPSTSSVVLASVGIFGSMAFLLTSSLECWSHMSITQTKAKADLEIAQNNNRWANDSIELLKSNQGSGEIVAAHDNYGINPWEKRSHTGMSTSSLAGHYQWDISTTPNKIDFLLKKNNKILTTKTFYPHQSQDFEQFKNECIAPLMQQMRWTALKRIPLFSSVIFALGMGSALLLESLFFDA
jgi:hypothetical protein